MGRAIAIFLFFAYVWYTTYMNIKEIPSTHPSKVHKNYVSDTGKFYTSYKIDDTPAIRFENRTLYEMSQSQSEDGYMSVKIKKIRRASHRLVAQAFLPPVEGKLIVHHKNAIRNDNRATNLEWVTQAENMHYAINEGRFTYQGYRTALFCVRCNKRNNTKKCVEHFDDRDVVWHEHSTLERRKIV